METWPLGVFTSVDAGLGVKLEVARDLGVPTIQIHAPHEHTRTQAAADAFLKKLKEYNIYCSEEMIDGLLTYVQTEGRRLKRHLTDEEFLTALGEGYAKRRSDSRYNFA